MSFSATEIEEGLLHEAQDSTPTSELNGTEVLDAIDRFISRFVSYPSIEARHAHVLWIVHTWLMEFWDSTPRIAFLSPEPGSGKSRALEVTEPLVPRAIHAVNTTPAYLFRKVSDPGGAPTILYDEIDTVFGPKAKDNEDIRGMLNAGHRRGATAGRCVARGSIVFTEELPAYCAVALAGLDDLPDTIRSRSIIVRMRRRSPNERVEPWRQRINGGQAIPIAKKLEQWTDSIIRIPQWPEMPKGVEDRDADVWEALIAVADLAGDDWPKRARTAAVSLVTQAREDSVTTLGLQLLSDLREIFSVNDRLRTDDVIENLLQLPESAWKDLRGKPLDARSLSLRLRKYEIKSKTIRFGEKTAKGYERADLEDAWQRYLPSGVGEGTVDTGERVTTVTSVTALLDDAPRVTNVTSVTDESERAKPLPPGQGFCSGCRNQGYLDASGLCVICSYEAVEDDRDEAAIRREAAGH